MKKGFILFTALFLISTFTAFAAVKVAKEGDVVKVTWTYENADAVSVGLVGDFQGWNLAGSLPMTKDANGVWTITLDGNASSEYKYKFNVDGEWTEDPTAPTTSEDGFGGLNGYVIVADLLAAAPAPGAAAAAPASTDRLYFGTYTALRVVSEFEKDKAVTQLRGHSYLKYQGNILPKTPIFMEIQWMQGSVDLYKQADKNNEWKINNMGDLLFQAPHMLNDGGSHPVFGHFRMGVQTDLVDVTLYQRYAKTFQMRDYFFDVYRELDAWNGALEFTKTVDLDSLKLKWFVGLSKRPNWSGADGDSAAGALNNGAILRGVQSFVTATVGDYEVQAMYNTREVAALDFEYMSGNLNHQVALAAKGKVSDNLDFTLQGLSHFINANAGKLSGSPDWAIYANKNIAFSSQSAVGAKINFKADMFKLGTLISWAGKDFQLGHFFGRNGDDKGERVNTGYLRATLKPSVTPVEGLTVGVDYTLKMDEEFKPVADGGSATLNETKLYTTYDPLGLGFYAKADFNQIDKDNSGLNFKEVAALVDLQKAAGVPTGSKVYLAYLSNNAWNATDKAYVTNTSEIHVVSANDLSAVGIEGLAVNLGLISRLEGKAKVANDGAFGVSGGIGYRMVDWKKADLFINFGYKAWLYDGAEGDRSSNIDLDGYRFAETTDLGAANMRIAFGVKWDF